MINHIILFGSSLIFPNTCSSAGVTVIWCKCGPASKGPSKGTILDREVQSSSPVAGQLLQDLFPIKGRQSLIVVATWADKHQLCCRELESAVKWRKRSWLIQIRLVLCIQTCVYKAELSGEASVQAHGSTWLGCKASFRIMQHSESPSTFPLVYSQAQMHCEFAIKCHIKHHITTLHYASVCYCSVSTCLQFSSICLSRGFCKFRKSN